MKDYTSYVFPMLKVEPGTYCVMPFLNKAGSAKKYMLRIATEKPSK